MSKKPKKLLVEKPAEESNQHEKTPKSGLSFRQSLMIALVSSVVTLLVTMITSSFSTALGSHLANSKDSTFQRREKLEELLTLAYALPNELRRDQTLRWTAAVIKGPKMVTENYESEDWFKAMHANPSESLYRFRSISTVYFPELDKQAAAIVRTHDQTEARGSTCIRDNFLTSLKSKSREISIRELFPAPECVMNFYQGAERLESDVQNLVVAARQRLRVYFYDPDMIEREKQ
jgi:K+-sensing histidine kinase KdpD